jgi:hypothetical protein
MKGANQLFGNEIKVSKFDYSRTKWRAGIFQEFQSPQKIVHFLA